MKLVYLLTALTFFLLLSYLTYPAKREETLKPVEKQDFFFEDFTHGTTIAGSWLDKDYVVKMQIESIKVDLKLVFEFIEDKGSANVNSNPSKNRTPKHSKIHMFKESTEYPQNATCRVHKTFQRGSPSLLTSVSDLTGTTAKETCNKCCEIAGAMAEGVWNGITWATGWIGKKVTWLADKAWNGTRWLIDELWNGFAWIADKAWNGLTGIVERIWNGIVWMEDRASNGLKWIGKLFLPGNFVTDAAVKFYYGYLDTHMKCIQAHIARQDVFYMMCTVIAVNFALLVIYLLVTSTVNFIRRLWQARKDRIAAANLPPTPKKPIWRPKPKKKRRNKKNSW